MNRDDKKLRERILARVKKTAANIKKRMQRSVPTELIQEPLDLGCSGVLIEPNRYVKATPSAKYPLIDRQETVRSLVHLRLRVSKLDPRSTSDHVIPGGDSFDWSSVITGPAPRGLIGTSWAYSTSLGIKKSRKE